MQKGSLDLTKCPLAQEMESFAFLPPLNSGARPMLVGGCKFGVTLFLLLEAGVEKMPCESPVHVFGRSRASGSSTLCVEEVGRATAPTLKLIQK